MARMKFLCDAELHRVQRLRDRVQAGERRPLGRQPTRGHHQRRRARRALDLGRLHALLGRPAWRCVRSTASTATTTASCSTTGPVHRLRLLLLRLPVRRAAVPADRRVRRGKMDKCTFCAGGPEPNNSEANSEIRSQPPSRRQAAGVRGNVLDQGAARRRRRRAVGHIASA